MKDPLFTVIEIIVEMAPALFWISLFIYVRKVIRPKVMKRYGKV